MGKPAGTKKPATTAQRRQKILLTAEKLFAKRGINAVSLNEVNKAAGQKNTSALHYHFGSKQRLIDAILDQHYHDIESRLTRLLEKLVAKSGDNISMRDVVVTFITPFAECLSSARGVCYLQIYSQLLATDFRLILFGRETTLEAAAQKRLFHMLKEVMGTLPQQAQTTRMISFTSLMFHSLAAFSHFAAANGKNPYGSKKKFLHDLANILVAVLTAPDQA